MVSNFKKKLWRYDELWRLRRIHTKADYVRRMSNRLSKKNSDIRINRRPTTELEEDEKSIQFLKELDPTGEYRKELRSWYFAEESRRRFDGRF